MSRPEPSPSAGAPRQLPITVVIAAYNRETTIVRALQSVWAQEHTPAEVLVVDDASSDDTAATARATGATVIERDENGGAAAARNVGIEAATQPWIAFLDSDDEWLPDHLSILWPHTKTHALVTGATVSVDDSTGTRSFAGVRRRRYLRTPLSLVFPDNFVSSGGVIVSTKVLRQAHGFDEQLRYSEDLDLWLRILERHQGIAVPDPVMLYHVHAGQKTSRLAEAREAQWEFLQRFRSATWWSERTFRRRVALNQCELRIVGGHRATAARRLVIGLVTDPATFGPVVLRLAAQSIEPRIPGRLRTALAPAGTDLS